MARRRRRGGGRKSSAGYGTPRYLGLTGRSRRNYYKNYYRQTGMWGTFVRGRNARNSKRR